MYILARIHHLQKPSPPPRQCRTKQDKPPSPFLSSGRLKIGAITTHAIFCCEKGNAVDEKTRGMPFLRGSRKGSPDPRPLLESNSHGWRKPHVRFCNLSGLADYPLPAVTRNRCNLVMTGRLGSTPMQAMLALGCAALRVQFDSVIAASGARRRRSATSGCFTRKAVTTRRRSGFTARRNGAAASRNGIQGDFTATVRASSKTMRKR